MPLFTENETVFPRDVEACAVDLDRLACDKAVFRRILYEESPTAFFAPTAYLYNIYRSANDPDAVCKLTRCANERRWFFLGHNSLSMSSSSIRYVTPGTEMEMTYILRKGLPEQKDFDAAMLRIRETGILSRINRRYVPGPPGDCPGGEDESSGFVKVSCRWENESI